MVARQKNCRIPSELVPRCPVCGGYMEVNLRCDGYFVEDEAWMRACGRYEDFLRENKDGRVVYLELGVGMNTPGIIKYPFWQMTDKTLPPLMCASICQRPVRHGKLRSVRSASAKISHRC